MDDIESALLAAVLDAIVPAHGSLAGAGGLGLGTAVLADADALGATATVVAVLGELPVDFLDLDPAAQEASLSDVESAYPAAFRTLINLVYTAYYTDPRALRAIEAATGYNAGPPQPQGYVLETFDEGLLERVKLMDPIWRRVP